MTDEDPGHAPSNLWNRWGVVRTSITKLGKRLRDLEGTPNEPGVSDRSRQLPAKLDILGVEFKTLHLQIVDLIDEEAAELEAEQDMLNRHDDDITGLSVRL